METPDISNSARPQVLAADHPTATIENPTRATGANKIKIHPSNIDGILPAWLAPPGVLRATIDLGLVNSDDFIVSLAHSSETTLFERQIRVEGFQLITSQRTENTLDKVAATLLRGFLSTQCESASGDDEILTRFGFRTSKVANDRLAFIERLVALQLIIRRCLELHATATGGIIPLFGYPSPAAYNTTDWDQLLADSEEPGAASPQKKSAVQQITEVEANADATAAATAATVNSQMVEQIAQTMARLEAALRAQSDKVDELERAAKRPRVDTGESAFLPSLPSNPNPAYAPGTLPAIDPGMVADAERRRISNIITQQPEIDPASSVNRMVVAEVATKFRAHQRITAEYVYSVTCTADQTKKLNFTSDGAGGIQMDQVDTSRRKISTYFHLEQITKSVIDTLSSIHEYRDAGHKLQQSFPLTIARAHAKYRDNVSLTTAYWNRHFNAWATGLQVSGENFSLKFNQDFWDEVKDDAHIATDNGRDQDSKTKAFKDLQRQLKNLSKGRSGGTGDLRSDIVGDKQSGNAAGPRGPIVMDTAHINADMRSSKCINFKSGRKCMVHDQQGRCVFSHEGITFGEDPSAARKRYDANTK